MSKPEQARFTAALTLVEWLDEALQRGYPHLRRDNDGQLIRTMDEAVREILANNLAIGEREKQL